MLAGLVMLPGMWDVACCVSYIFYYHASSACSVIIRTRGVKKQCQETSMLLLRWQYMVFPAPNINEENIKGCFLLPTINCQSDIRNGCRNMISHIRRSTNWIWKQSIH